MTTGYQGLDAVSWRPLTAIDLPAVYALEAAGEAFDDGAVEVDLSDLEGDWSRPAFDPAAMSLGAFEGPRLVGYALVFQGRAEALVHPEHRGRGLGTRLARWTWEVARSEGRDRVGQTISDNELSAIALFTALGYERGHTAWILRIDLTAAVPAVQLPPGYAFRTYRPGVDDREIYGLIDEAFAEWRNADSESMGFDNWAASTLRGFAPEGMVLLEYAGRLVGAAVGCRYGGDSPHAAGDASAAEGGAAGDTGDAGSGGPGEGWIDQIAARREHRGRGLGRALLQESFRRFKEGGLSQAGVSTDSRTGALGLYEHAGMTVVRSYTRWVKVGL